MDRFKWGYEDLSFEKDRAYGFSWPQRNYRCSFCKKEFRSAQALGGHMNVHRRDRARMRLSPNPSPNLINPNLNSNPNPNPDPSFPCSSPATRSVLLPSYNSSSVTGVADSHSSVCMMMLDGKKAPVVECPEKIDIKKLYGGSAERGIKNKGAVLELTRRSKDARVWKGNRDLVRLDLKMGLLQDSKEDLDLELRLGYSKLD